MIFRLQFSFKVLIKQGAFKFHATDNLLDSQHLFLAVDLI